jgi:hypothetical protein
MVTRSSRSKKWVFFIGLALIAILCLCFGRQATTTDRGTKLHWLISLSQVNGQVRLGQISFLDGYSDDPLAAGSDRYRYELLGRTGKILDSGHFQLPEWGFADQLNGTELIPQPQMRLTGTEFPLLVPFQKKGESLALYSPVGERLLTVALPRQASPANTTVVDAGECVTIEENNKNTGLSIVFVGDQGSSSKPYSMSNFQTDLNAAMARFRATSPYAENMSRMNFYYVNQIFNLNCRGIAFPTLCSVVKTKQAAAACPHSQVIVFTSTGNGGLGPWGTGYAFMSAAWLVVHEFSHSFGALGDEYMYMQPEPSPVEFPNCTKTPSQSETIACPAWSWAENVSSDIGCYKGCGWRNLYRPTAESCLLRNAELYNYDAVCHKHIEDKLLQYGN